MPAYVELQVTSNFSFLRGASHPHELVTQAKALGHAGAAIADRNSLAGVVRGHVAAKEEGIPFLVGARLDLADAPPVLCFPTDRAAYGRLTRLLSIGPEWVPKGTRRLTFADLAAAAEGQIAVVLPPDTPDPAFAEALRRFAGLFGARAHLAAQHLYRGDDAQRLARLAALARDLHLRLVATNDVQFHVPERRMLQDVVACIRDGTTIDAAGFRLAAHAERHLKAPAEMARLFRAHPDALAATLDIARACRFSLDDLRYEYPVEPVPEGRTPQAELARLAWEGARARYPAGPPDTVRSLILRELELIGRLGYAPYFLTVHDIVRFARSQGILCQGRGSAANSVICYCLGITAVGPEQIDLLFERFVSAERNEPPDIDVDFEHERREEVIQYVYGKYGRHRAGLAATVIHYRARRAVREVGKVMGLTADTIDALARSIWGWSDHGIDPAHIRQAGLDPDSPRLAETLRLTCALIGFPRHLSQHVGGFVITKSRLDEVVPVVEAAMEQRTVVEWDKDDLDALGILKIDVLALGMLTCMRKGLDLLRRHRGLELDLATIPREDPAVYDMLCRGDSVGVFQVESRAQMSMLPRLKPRTFYDLVIEVAIVRPGPIQGDMVHPFLRRRSGKEPVSYPSEALRAVLHKTMGVPLFQEQAMKIAIVAAGFTPDEADRLRRAMATFRRNGIIHTLRDKLIAGMVAKGYDRNFALRCYGQIEGFGSYGFPESHAASFALLVYASSWLKCHHPAAFACALLNSQPMGFYAPAQIVRDARDHGVTVRPVDVNRSDWDCTLEPDGPALALRLGFRQAKGLQEAEMTRLVATRGALGRPFADLAELRAAAGLSARAFDGLARADAFGSLSRSRREALWDAIGIDAAPDLPLFAAAERRGRMEDAIALPAAPIGEEVSDDYRSLALTLRTHPLALLRPRLAPMRVVRAKDLPAAPDGARLTVGGLVLIRQRPGTASGVIFVTLEDESGVVNLVVWPSVFERFRRVVLGAQMMLAEGRLQREGLVIHVVADRLADRTDMLRDLAQGAAGSPVALPSPLARADEVSRPSHERRPPPRYRSRDFH